MVVESQMKTFSDESKATTEKPTFLSSRLEKTKRGGYHGNLLPDTLPGCLLLCLFSVPLLHQPLAVLLFLLLLEVLYVLPHLPALHLFFDFILKEQFFFGRVEKEPSQVKGTMTRCEVTK